MDKLLGIRLFCCIAEQRSFVAAAGRFNLSPTMVSKHLQALERDLGVRLVNRTSRHVSLTEAGALYFEQTQQWLESLDTLEAAVAGNTAAARGVLRLSAPEWLANRPFVELLAQYQARFPEVQLHIDLSRRLVNLVEEGFDLVIRATPNPDETMIARPLGQVRLLLVGSPAYLARHGRPLQLSDLAHHDLLWQSMVSRDTLTLDGPNGKETVKLRLGMRSTSEDMLRLAAIQGMGLVGLPEPVAARDIADGRLEVLLPHYPPLTNTIFLMYPSRKYLSAKVRSFIDFLTEDGRFAAAAGPAGAGA